MVRAQQTVELRPYDVEAWSVLLREAQNRPVNDVRSLYESLVAVFPTTARFWKIFIEQEVTERTFTICFNSNFREISTSSPLSLTQSPAILFTLYPFDGHFVDILSHLYDILLIGWLISQQTLQTQF